MPFKSKAEERWMFANKPEMAKRWAAETPDQSALPQKVNMDKKTKRDPHGEALSDLHSMLSEAIAHKLKAKTSAKLDRSKAKADAPSEELGESGEPLDADDDKAMKKKVAFGAKGK